MVGSDLSPLANHLMPYLTDMFQSFVRLFISAIVLIILLHPSVGLYLERIDLNSLRNTRIAYYPGSFDPIHLGHMAVVDTVLDKKLADYILVYALPSSDGKKKRTPYVLRMSMLECLYKEHPKVLITKLTPAAMQEMLRPLFNVIEFSVVQGSDVISEYVANSQYDALWMQGLSIKDLHPEQSNTALGAIMAIPAKRVIAFNRAGDDLSYIGRTYKNRPITILKAPSNGDLSSTKARFAVKNGHNLADVVPAEVIEIIKDNKLYKN